MALYARRGADFEDKVRRTLQTLQDAACRHTGRIVQATSLGAEDMVVTDLIARHRLGIAVATLDTGLLHAPTRELMQRLGGHYGLALEIYRPDPAATAAFVDEHGDKAMYRSVELRKQCCALRKLEPLSRMLAGRSAWVTGLRREQSAQRGDVPFSEIASDGREKLNVLADWRWQDVWHYIAENSVPYNPLHDAFYPSIGCAPCTRAVTPGEDLRSGRWWWETQTARECGLHVQDTTAGATRRAPATPTGDAA